MKASARFFLLAGAPLLCACAGAPPEPETPAVCDTSESTSLPPWASSPSEPRAPATVLSGPPRETVHIAAPPEVDPVDRVLSRLGGRNRIQNLSLRQAPLDDTLRMFARMGRFNVVMADSVRGRAVTLELHSVTVASAFKAVLASAKMEARVLADNIVEVRPAGENVPEE